MSRYLLGSRNVAPTRPSPGRASTGARSNAAGGPRQRAGRTALRRGPGVGVRGTPDCPRTYRAAGSDEPFSRAALGLLVPFRSYP
jgi:hypothetical protein